MSIYSAFRTIAREGRDCPVTMENRVVALLDRLREQDAVRLSNLLKQHPLFLFVHDPSKTGQKETQYFRLAPDCFLIKGAARCAIYDLKSGDVYSIRMELASAIEDMDAGSTIGDVLRSLTEHNRVSVLQAMAFLNEIGVGEYVLDRLPTQAPPRRPLQLERLFLEVTEGCNLHCVHCYASSSPEKFIKPDIQHEDWWRDVLRQGRFLGASEVSVAGGEPMLLGSGLFELFGYARDLGYSGIELLTNATIFKRDQVKLMRDLGVCVAVSFYAADPVTHRSVTGAARSLGHIVRNLKLLQEYDIPIRIAVTIMDENRQKVDETVDFLSAELGITKINFNFPFSIGRASSHTQISQARVKGLTVTRELREARFPKIDKDTFIRRISGHSCWAGRLCISSHGQVTPCPFDRTTVLGNVHEQSLEAIVQNPLTTKLWRLSKDEVEECKDCEYRYVCFDCRPAAAENIVQSCSVPFRRCGEEETAMCRDTEEYLTRKPNYCYYDPYRGVWQRER